MLCKISTYDKNPVHLILFQRYPLLEHLDSYKILHKRFRLEKPAEEDYDAEMGGLVILNLDGIKISIIIDRISRVVMINAADIKPPPQMLTGIGSEYIHGVVQQQNGYLIVLNIRKLFDPKELQKLISAQN